MRLPSPAPLLLAAALALLLAPAPLPATDTHVLSGTLVGPDGRAVPGVPLRARLREKGAPLLATRTDAAGRWRLEGLAEGTWILQAGIPGTGVVHQRSVEVPAVQEYPFLIHLGRSKRGRAFDEGTGRPAAGVVVFDSTRWHEPGFPCWVWTPTGEDGRWRIEGATEDVCNHLWYSGHRHEVVERGTTAGREEVVVLRRPPSDPRREDVPRDVAACLSSVPVGAATCPEWVPIGTGLSRRAPGDRRVEGRVSDAATGLPVSGAVIDWIDGIGDLVWSDREWTCVAVADGEGRFQVGGLSARGTLRVQAPLRTVLELPLDEAARCENLLVALEAAPPSPGEPPPKPSADPVFPTAPERTIRGRVLDGEGRPASRVHVEAGSLDRAARFYRQDRTDAEGRFVLFGMPEGRHDLRVWGDEDHPEQVAGSAERGAQDVLLRMTPHPALEGRVLDLDGTPAAGVEVAVKYRHSTARTGEDGRFRFPLKPGRAGIEIRCSPDRFAPFMTVEHPAREPLEFRLRRAGFIRGIVVDIEGDPVAGVRVEVDDSLFGARKYGNVYYTSQRPPERRKEATTDAEGRFTVGGLDPEGNYTVGILNPKLLPGNVVPEGSYCRDVRVDGEEVPLLLPR